MSYEGHSVSPPHVHPDQPTRLPTSPQNHGWITARFIGPSSPVWSPFAKDCQCVTLPHHPSVHHPWLFGEDCSHCLSSICVANHHSVFEMLSSGALYLPSIDIVVRSIHHLSILVRIRSVDHATGIPCGNLLARSNAMAPVLEVQTGTLTIVRISHRRNNLHRTCGNTSATQLNRSRILGPSRTTLGCL